MVNSELGKGVSSMKFLASSGLSKPLASVARLTALDNTIVMWGSNEESYIQNEKTGMTILVYIENVVYVMDVGVLLKEGAEPVGRCRYRRLTEPRHSCHKTDT